MSGVPLVRVVRSGFEEAVHLGSVAVADVDGRVVAWAGDPQHVTFARSSMKPLQAAVSLTLSGEALTDDEVAVMCASHNGEDVHVRAVASILSRAGLGFDALQTPPDRPFDEETALRIPEPRPEYHNCSGKHAGMLLASVRRGFDPASYRQSEHPLQDAVLGAVRDAAGADPVAVGVDGCGVPVHALSLASMARLYARLAAEAVAGADRVVGAMRASPYLVAGRTRMCTAVMEAVHGVVVKVGAEGLVCAGSLDGRLGIAVKIADGAARAAEPALVRAMAVLGLLPDDALGGPLRPYARPPVLGGGRPVGELIADFGLHVA
jgi:L-asparaginase II